MKLDDIATAIQSKAWRDLPAKARTYYAARKIIDRLPWTHIEKVANDATIHPETGTVESPVGDQLK